MTDAKGPVAVIQGPIDVVFDVLSQLTEFPTWWSVFKSVESDDPEFGVGAGARVRTRVVLPYNLDWDLTVAAKDRPRLLQFDATVLLGCTPSRWAVVNASSIRARYRRPSVRLNPRNFSIRGSWPLCSSPLAMGRPATWRQPSTRRSDV